MGVLGGRRRCFGCWHHDEAAIEACSWRPSTCPWTSIDVPVVWHCDEAAKLFPVKRDTAGVVDMRTNEAEMLPK